MYHRTGKKVSNYGMRGKRTAWLMRGAVLPLIILLFLLVMLNFTTSTSVADSIPCDCQSCHGDFHGENWAGCSGCHDSPPQTGTHRVHYNTDPQTIARYGDTTVSSTADAYLFGCGNCHPLNSSKHLDGIVQVELYDAASPAGSLKAKNPLSAAYTPGGVTTTYAHKIAGQPDFSYTDGTCNNVYCHSGYTITSGPVGYPLYTNYGGGNEYILDENGNFTYAPYEVTYSRVYRTTPPWGTSAAFSTCTECHDFPLTTSYPSVQAGVGDSHQWIDNYGYGNLHAFNMAMFTPFDALSCRTCHYGTITQAGTWTRDSMDITTYDPVPLSSRVFHVNGTPDIVFDTTNPIIYFSFYNDATVYDLNTATYNPETKTCSNVACHQAQTVVKWGSPYRWWTDECNACHRI
jgi:predicted CxxxxCH...CXXCH cytochrome family protein